MPRALSLNLGTYSRIATYFGEHLCNDASHGRDVHAQLACRLPPEQRRVLIYEGATFGLTHIGPCHTLPTSLFEPVPVSMWLALKFNPFLSGRVPYAQDYIDVSAHVHGAEEAEGKDSDDAIEVKDTSKDTASSAPSGSNNEHTTCAFIEDMDDTRASAKHGDGDGENDASSVGTDAGSLYSLSPSECEDDRDWADLIPTEDEEMPRGLIVLSDHPAADLPVFAPRSTGVDGSEVS